MIQEESTTILFYNSGREDLYITEFGHSMRKTPHKVGPWIRDVYLLHFVIKGMCHFSDFEVASGEAFLISKGSVHSFTVDTGYEHFWIGFDGTKVPILSTLFDLNLGNHQHLQLLNTPVNLSDEYRNLFERGNESDSETAVISLLMSTLSLINNNSRKNQNNGYVNQGKNFIDHNYHRKITMDEVAAYINLSEKYMCRLFKQEMGITPLRYLMSVRMEHAKELLRWSDMRIRDISCTVGYNSQLAFSAAFSAYVGMSPTEYRENKYPPLNAIVKKGRHMEDHHVRL